MSYRLQTEHTRLPMEWERWGLCGFCWGKTFQVLQCSSTTVSPSEHSRGNCSSCQIPQPPRARRLPGKKMDKDIFKKSPQDHLPYLIRKSTFWAVNESWVSHEDSYHITHWNSMYNDTLVYTVVRIIIFVCLINLYFMPTTQRLILYSFRGRK